VSAPPSKPSPVDHEPIVGPVVSFRLVEEWDLLDILRWRRDPEVVEFWGEPLRDIDAARRHYTEPIDEPTWRFVIELGGRGVGEIQYWHPHGGPDWTWSVGIDIFIGEREARNRGIGTEAVRTMLRYLFEVKGCHRVTIDPQTENARAIRCYEKVGFRLDGVLRHNDRIAGRYVDTHFMSMLEDEWLAAKARWETMRAGFG
jgi:aminoglycoside 6'-N-acetyltransferase